MNANDARRNSLITGAIAFLIAVLPFTFYAGPGSFILPRLALSAICACISLSSIFIFSANVKSSIRIPLILFIILYSFSALFAPVPQACIKTILLVASGCAIAFCVSRIKGICPMLLFQNILLLAGMVYRVHGIFQFYNFDFHILASVRQKFRVFSFAGTPAAFGALISVCLCISASRLLPASHHSKRFLYSFLIFVYSFSIFLSTSRSSMTGMLAGTIFCVMLFIRFRPGSRALPSIALLFILIAAGFAASFLIARSDRQSYLAAHPEIHPEAHTVTELKRNSIQQRLFTLKCGYFIFMQHPAIGGGPGSFTTMYPLAQASLLAKPDVFKKYIAVATGRIATHAHNEPLEIAVESGIAGVAVFIFLIVSVFIAIFRHSRSDSDKDDLFYVRAAFASAFVAMLIHSFFEFTLHDPLTSALFWICLGASVRMPGSDTRCDCPPPPFTGLRLAVVIALIGIASAAPRPFIASLVMMQANLAARDGDFGRSLKLLDSARKLDPYSTEILSSNASALIAAGRTEEAAAILRDALNFSNSPELYNVYGALSATIGRLNDAEEAFLTLIAIDPLRASSWRNLGIVYLKAGKNREAQFALDRAQKLATGFSP